MGYYKCKNCHHEFELIPDNRTVHILCDWCSAPAYIIEEKTPLEKMVNEIEEEGGFEKWAKKWGLDK